MNPEWKARYECAIEAVQTAGQIALQYFQSTFEVEWKQDESPVTVADREAEQVIRDTISKHFPDDGFLGEEHGEAPSNSGYRWIIDPIDGTRNFVRRIPLWGTLVGLEYQNDQIAGIVGVPALGDLYRALRGDGAYCNDRKIHVNDERDLSKSMILYSSLSWYKQAGRQEDFLRLIDHSQRQLGYGDFYGFVLVAQGSGDAMIDHGVHVWDVAAIKPLIEEAGGRYSDWNGNPDIHRTDVIVSNGHLHEEILSILNASS